MRFYTLVFAHTQQNNNPSRTSEGLDYVFKLWKYRFATKFTVSFQIAL